MHDHRRAFTLIELLIVVAIIGILAAIAVPNFLNAQVRAKVARSYADMKTIGTAIESSRLDRDVGRPAVLTSAVAQFQSEFARCIARHPCIDDDRFVAGPIAEWKSLSVIVEKPRTRPGFLTLLPLGYIELHPVPSVGCPLAGSLACDVNPFGNGFVGLEIGDDQRFLRTNRAPPRAAGEATSA